MVRDRGATEENNMTDQSVAIIVVPINSKQHHLFVLVQRYQPRDLTTHKLFVFYHQRVSVKARDDVRVQITPVFRDDAVYSADVSPIIMAR